MGRKVLQGFAKNLCQIFLGYQSYNDLPRMAELGKGEYEIDILKMSCKKDGIEIELLATTNVLQTWFFSRLMVEKIHPEQVNKAKLIIKLIDIHEGPLWQFRVGDKKMRLSKLKSTVLVFECTSHIQAFDREYVAHDTGQRDFV